LTPWSAGVTVPETQHLPFKAARSVGDKGTASTADTVEERARKTQERYGQRLEEQLGELAHEHLAATLSEDERKEILREVIQEALLEIVNACQEVAKSSGLIEGKAVAELIAKKLRPGSVVEKGPELR
jgi:hypothetical protein